MKTSRGSGGRERLLVVGMTLVALAASGLVLMLALGQERPVMAAEARVFDRLSPEELASPDKKMEHMMKDVGQGALRVAKADGELVECPLQHTDVKAEISGFIARVKVTQTFFNPLNEKIEAIYVFPLPHKAAVDDMTMVLSGGRKIVGVIKRRAEARQIYEQALAQGATAALLEQERPNIFTQSVGNIDPNEKIDIEITYVDVLDYDAGTYQFQFPMVVGPRYIPGGATTPVAPVPPELQGKVGEAVPPGAPPVAAPAGGAGEPKGTGWAPDTDRVPDASRITPPVLKPEFRNGHDVSLSVTLEAGVPIQDLQMVNHKGSLDRVGATGAKAAIAQADSIPNKDFLLRYRVVGEKPAMALLPYARPGAGGGYFMLMIQPKLDEKLKNAPPREIVFLVDVSGSMSGPPTAKVREAMAGLLKLCKAEDIVQVITFANQSQKLFEKALPANEETIAKALNFTAGLQGSGGTEMLKGIQMAINDPLDGKRVRMVVLLTDGFIGNESEIIAEVGRSCGDQIRFWCIGIGSSPNMMLVDGVAKQGGGMGKVLPLTDKSQPLVEEMMMRIHRAQMANIRMDWGGARVEDVYPAKIPELWAERPVILFGRYRGSAEAVKVTVNGTIEGEPASWPLTVSLPASESRNEVLSKVWARQKIEDLMQSTYYAGSPAVEEEVTRLALDYRLMSQYTSFVAVDEKELDKTKQPMARPPRRMLVPVPIPEGTRFEGFFGGEDRDEVALDGTIAMADLKKDKQVLYMTLGASAMGYSGSAGVAPSPASPPTVMIPVTRMSSGSGSMGVGGGGGPMPTEESAVPYSKVYRYPSAGEWADLSSRRKAMVSSEPARGRRSEGKMLLREGPGNSDEGGLFAWDDHYGRQWGSPVMQAQRPAVTKQAQEAFAAAETLAKDGKTTEARAKFVWACLLDSAANYGAPGEIGGKALDQISTLDGSSLKLWAKELPALEKRLDLLIRDQSLENAVAAVAKAGKFDVRVTPGSIGDAESMAEGSSRVTWLDLRGATVAQALDWLLRPARLQWRVDGKTVVVASARRYEGLSAWVYDVAALAWPTQKDLEATAEQDKQQAAVQKSCDQLFKAVRDTLKLPAEAIAWSDPGRLVILADAATHERAAQLLADLANAEAKVDAGLAELHKETSRRAADRKESQAKAAEARAVRRTLAGLAQPSWQLLSAAAGGESDLEALTVLQVAWRSGEMDKVLGDERLRAAALRSLWAIRESARALPKDGELSALAESVAKRSRAAAEAAAALMEKSPQDGSAVLGAAYAWLAWRDDAELAAKLQAAMNKAPADGPAARVRNLVAALIASPESVDRTALEAVLKNPLGGDDATVLTALACRRAGGAIWDAWRGAAARTLGEQPLSGQVVVLTSRLPSTALPLVATAKAP